MYYDCKFERIHYNNETDFLNKIEKGTVFRIKSKYVTGSSFYKKRIRDYITVNKIPVYEFGEYAYLLYYSWLYAKENNKKYLMDLIKERFDYAFNVNKSEQYKINRIDQMSYGCLSIELFRYYKDIHYKEFAQKLFLRLDLLDRQNGIVLYSDDGLQNVDAIGLICPFLFNYYNEFKNKRALEISMRMINNYLEKGVDYYSGMPVQSYNYKTGEKARIANWGRGTAWFLLGILDVKNSIEDKYKILLDRLDNTLLKSGPVYSQYLGEETSKADMSATIPINYYLVKSGLKTMTKLQFIKLISSYTDENGYILYNSPSIALPYEIPNSYQKHDVSQGIALYFLSILK